MIRDHMTWLDQQCERIARLADDVHRRLAESREIADAGRRLIGDRRRRRKD